MHVSTLVLVIFPIFVLTSNSLDDDSYLTLDLSSIDRSNYVDPHDMLNYNRKEIQVTPKEKGALKTSSDQILQGLTTGQIDKNKSSLKDDDQTIVSEKASGQPMSKCLTEPTNCSSCSNNTKLELPFLSRFVRILSTRLQLKEKIIEDGDVLYIPLLAVINARTQFVLNKVIKDGEEIQHKYLADLDEILSNLLIPNENKFECRPDFSFVEWILKSGSLRPKEWITVMFIACLWFVLWLTFKGHSYLYILSRSLLPFFIICWFWHWNHMDQIASSKRYSDLSKNTDIPSSCNPEQLGILESLRLKFNAFRGHPDPCEEYHRVLLTDPSYEVNPFTVLIDMLAVGIFHPLRNIGKQVGSFFDGVLNSATAFNTIPVFLAVLLGLFIILVMTFRYEIHLPMFQLRPSPSVAIPSSGAIQELMHPSRIADVTDQLAHHDPYAQVQVVKERVQAQVEDCPENASLSPVIIEELVDSVLCIQADIETITIMVVADVLPVECSQDAEEKFESETSSTTLLQHRLPSTTLVDGTLKDTM